MPKIPEPDPKLVNIATFITIILGIISLSGYIYTQISGFATAAELQKLDTKVENLKNHYLLKSAYDELFDLQRIRRHLTDSKQYAQTEAQKREIESELVKIENKICKSENTIKHLMTVSESLE